MVYDSYAKEMVLEPTGIVKAKKPVRQDKAEGMKRVELHLHTTSVMPEARGAPP